MARRGAPFVAFAAILLTALAPFGAVRAEEGDPAAVYQWGVEVVGAREAQKSATGKGIVIAVLDTGVDLEHEDLKAKLVPGRNVIDPGAKPQDDSGQGTHVAGIAAAITGNGKGVMGIAPDAKIMPVKVLDSDGDGDTDDIASGLRWAADHGAHVAYVGLESPLPARLEPLVAAVRYAWTLGVVPVIASGNQVARQGFANENALVVAATTRAGTGPRYSNGVGNAKWGIAAPGGADSDNDDDDILSTYWPHTEREPIGAQEFGRYAYDAGTSMAAGHVAGGVALMRSLGLSPQRAVERLLETARDIGADGRDTTFGAGLLDLAAAVKGLARPAAVTTTTAPGPTTTSTSAPVTTTAGRAGRTSSQRRLPSPTTAPPPPASGTASTFSPPTPTEAGSQDPDDASGLSATGPRPPDESGGGAGPAALAAVALLTAGAAGGGWWWRNRAGASGAGRDLSPD